MEKKIKSLFKLKIDGSLTKQILICIGYVLALITLRLLVVYM